MVYDGGLEFFQDEANSANAWNCWENVVTKPVPLIDNSKSP